MNIIKTDDKRYLTPWFPFSSFFDDEEIWPSKISGVKVSENDQNVLVELAVPGMSADNIDVQIENGVLTVRAAKASSESKEEKGEKVYVSSLRSSYNYSTTLPSSAGNDAVATLENGILKLKISKKEETKPRKIEVKNR